VLKKCPGIKTLGRVTTPLLKLPLTRVVIKEKHKTKNDIDLCNYNLPERNRFVTMVIKVMIKFNKGVMIRPIHIRHEPTLIS
jgi:hypothetical protein